MLMTQSSPFINRNAMKPNSPDRSDMGVSNRIPMSRASRYNFNKSEFETYNAFVNLISTFDQKAMADILEDVLKDAEERKVGKSFYHDNA